MGALVAELRQKTLVKAPVPQLWAAYTNVVRGLALPTLQSEDIVGLFQALAKSLQFEEAMEMMLQAALDVNDMGKQLPQAAFDILMRQAISELPADQIKATLWQIQGRRRFITEFIQLCDSNIEMKMFLGLYNQLNKASFDVDGFSTYFQSRKERAEKLSDMILQWINEDGRKVNIKVVENLMVFLLDRGVTDKVFATISALHKEGFSFNHGFFTSAIHRFGKERKFDYMEMSLELMRRQGLEPLEDTYAAVIDAHSKAGNLKEAQRAYQDALAAEFTPTDQVFGPMVEAVGRMGDYKMTRQLVHQMNSSGVPSNVYTFSSLLQSLAQDSDRSTQLFEEISKTVTPNTVNYNLLIRTFQRLGDLDGAFRVFRSMVKDGVRPDRYTFSSILNLFAVRGDSEGAETFWNEMVNVHNIVPNAHAYGSMMHVYCTTEDMLSAQAVYREMIQVGILPNEVIFGTLMNAYARRGDLTQMLSIYDAMRAEGLKPNSYIYSNLLFGLVQDGDMVAARHLYENMEEDGFGHNVLAQTILIKGYLDQGDIQESQQIYQNMLRSGLVPNFMTYAILLQAHVRRGEKKEGRKFLNKIMKSRGLVVVNDEDESLYDDGVDKLRMDQSHDRVGPSFPMITDGNEFSGRVEDGHLTLMGTERKPLKFASRPKPLMAFAPLLDAYAKEGNILAVEGMFEEIKARGLEPNTVIYTMLMDGYRRAGNVNAVLRIWGEIFGRFRLQWEDTQQHPENYRPLKDTTFVESVQDRLSTKGFKLQRLMQRPVSIILDSLSYSGRVLEAKTMWRQLEEMGFQFDSSNWNDYCIALTRNGRLMEACEVLRDKLLPGFKSNLPGAVQARARKPHSTSRRDIARSNFERNRLSPLQSIKEEEEEEERINSRPSTMFYPRPRTFAALADVLEDLLSLKGSSRTRSQDQLSNPVEKPLSGDSKISGYATTLGGSFSVRNRRLEKRRRLIDAQLETYPRPFAKLDENQRHILWNMVRSEYPTVIDALEEGILVAHESTNAASNSTGSTLPASGFDEMDAEKKKATAAAAASAKSSLNAEGKVETDTPVYRGFRQWRQLKFVMKDMQRKQFLDDHRTFNKERAGQFTRQRGHKPK
ncbi:hypothetical protein EDD11_000143 [Mortierella claussenii]|nr:hypothetical protein EDD11_000143 [Mortierella claussenii]